MESSDIQTIIKCTSIHSPLSEEPYINIHHICLSLSLVKYKVNYSHFILDILRPMIEYLKNNNYIFSFIVFLVLIFNNNNIYYEFYCKQVYSFHILMHNVLLI